MRAAGRRPSWVLRRGALLPSGVGEIDLPPDEPILLNPGAVGQSRSRDPRARVLVLDTGTRVASFHALDYDVAACRHALEQKGLPPTSCHLRPSRWAKAAGLVTRHVRRLR
jgi:hypothetical protein